MGKLAIYLIIGTLLAEAALWNKQKHNIPSNVEFTRSVYVSLVLLWPWYCITSFIARFFK